MNGNSLKTMLIGVKKSFIKNSPTILLIMGASSMVASTVYAVKATPKALSIIDEKKLTTRADIIRATWKQYLPAIISGTAGILCLVGSNSIHAKRNATLATVYKISETALTEYKDKVVELVGNKKAKEIDEKIYQDKIDKTPANNVIIANGNGDVLCFDSMSGQYFKADVDYLGKCINSLNESMLLYNYVSLNDLYEQLGLELSAIGDQIGWNIANGLVELNLGAQLSKDGVPCVVLQYNMPPESGFDNYN